MPVVVVADPGAPSANSFATLAEGNAYHEGHPFSAAWDDADIDQKNRVLIMATRMIARAFLWRGVATYPTTQALPFPRYSVLSRYNVVYAPTIIPLELKEATIELARLLLTKDWSAESDTAGLKSLRAGTVALEFDGTQAGKIIPDYIALMIAHLHDGLITSRPTVGTVTR